MSESSQEDVKKTDEGQMTLERILNYAVKHGASDIHLKIPRPPAVRIDGVMRFIGDKPLQQADLLGFLDKIMSPEEKKRFLDTGDVDQALSLPGLGRFRVNCFKQRGSPAIILRHVQGKVPDFSALNLPEASMGRIASLARGLVLVTGTTGSGKSTTLAAIIDRINHTRRAHIITLEDPIEFLHTDRKSSITQREISIDTKDFKTALRAAMREDPDVVLIGEMRDIETFEAAISAAETGHLVFSTLHTTNAMMTIDRIIDLFPADRHQQVRSQLSLQLQALVAQRLVPAADGKGRIPAVEVLFNTPAVSALIRENKIKMLDKAIAGGRAEGMQSFNVSLVGLVQAKLVTQQQAEWASDNAEELKMNLQGIFLDHKRGGVLKK